MSRKVVYFGTLICEMFALQIRQHRIINKAKCYEKRRKRNNFKFLGNSQKIIYPKANTRDCPYIHVNSVVVILYKSVGILIFWSYLGYRLRRVQKARPVEKSTRNGYHFWKCKKKNQASSVREDSLRISIDTKTKVDVGNLEQSGQSRG